MKVFRDLNRFERVLGLGSVCTVTAAFLLTGSPDVFPLLASLIGVTALVFVAKGYVLGQVLTVVFALFYGGRYPWRRYGLLRPCDRHAHPERLQRRLHRGKE